MIRVLVVDDQTLVRRGLAELLALAPDISVVGEAADGVEALRLARELTPDVILLDVRMPETNGLEVLAQLRSRGDRSNVVMITTFDDDQAVLEAVRRGARGFLLKDATLDELLLAVRTAASGGTFVRPVVTSRVLDGLREAMRRAGPARPGPGGSRGPEPAPDLTSREAEILRLLAGGYTNRELAGALGVAEGTVKNHISHLLAKMGVRDRSRAVLKGLDLGLI